MKKVSALLLALVLALTLALPAAVAAAPDLSGKLVILYTNDVHGGVLLDADKPAMGYEMVARYKKDALATGANVLLFDGGDFSQGQPIVNLSMGAQAVEFMNAAGYDACAIGNHEFDWGLDNLLQNREKASFTFLAANILRAAGGDLVFDANKIYEYGDMKIGVFGLATPETFTKANPTLLGGATFLQGEELYACAQAQVDELKAAGCTLIVCIGHLGIDEESVGNRSLDVIANTLGIDLFLDAHSHSEVNEEVDQKLAEGAEKPDTTLLVSSGTATANLVEVVYDGESLRACLIPASPSLVESGSGDADVAALVAGVNAAIDEQLSAVFATTSVLLNGERSPGVRTQETNLGDFCADAILWAAGKYAAEPAVCALTNGGGIRASIEAGDVTMKTMKTVFPFGNKVVTIKVTGAELLEALEAATFAAPEALGAFPQVAGIEFTLDTTVPYENGDQYADSTYFAPAKPGSRVTIATVGGEPFDPEKLYVLATNDFTAVGGDTYVVFKYPCSQTLVDTGVALEDALVEYTSEVLGGTIGDQYAEPAGRITIK